MGSVIERVRLVLAKGQRGIINLRMKPEQYFLHQRLFHLVLVFSPRWKDTVDTSWATYIEYRTGSSKKKRKKRGTREKKKLFDQFRILNRQ